MSRSSRLWAWQRWQILVAEQQVGGGPPSSGFRHMWHALVPYGLLELHFSHRLIALAYPDPIRCRYSSITRLGRQPRPARRVDFASQWV
jgi:hypothetical protein